MKRFVAPEEMDSEALSAKEHLRALKGLARINFFSRSAHNLWSAIEALAQENPEKPLRVLDIATGSGDIPIALWKRARKKGIRLEIDGCDKSSQALDFAKVLAEESGAKVGFFKLNIHHEVIPSGYDILISSLFLHHLQNGEALQFLRQMKEKAGRLVLVNDLVRSVPGLVLALLGTRLLCASRIVQADGVFSVRAAFSVSEMHHLLQDAGLDHARIERHWPSRFLLIWKRDVV